MSNFHALLAEKIGMAALASSGHTVSLRTSPDAEEAASDLPEERAESFVAGFALALFTVLRVRGIPISNEAGAQISAQKDVSRLIRWCENAAVATAANDVFDSAPRRDSNQSTPPKRRGKRPPRFK